MEERLPWMRYAKCRGVNPELFFPERGGQSQAVVEQAIAVCNGRDGAPPCPVKSECLLYALSRRERWGVWGGKSERQRKRIQKLNGHSPVSKEEAVRVAQKVRRRRQG